MEHYISIPAVVFFLALLLVVAIGIYIKFFRRDEAKERANEENRRNVLMRIAELQNRANQMQADIDNESQ
jgi:C4-dicarboxylate-specific signal transduction histidine kinase